jgi:hypothetical protein
MKRASLAIRKPTTSKFTTASTDIRVEEMSTALHQVQDVIRKVHDAAGIPRSLRSARRCRIDRLERHGCLLKSRHLRQHRPTRPRRCGGLSCAANATRTCASTDVMPSVRLSGIKPHERRCGSHTLARLGWNVWCCAGLCNAHPPAGAQQWVRTVHRGGPPERTRHWTSARDRACGLI